MRRSPKRRGATRADKRKLPVKRVADNPPGTDQPSWPLAAQLFRRILEHEFAAPYTLSGVYKLLHRLGYNDLMPRPQHPDADPEAQAFFNQVSFGSNADNANHDNNQRH